MENPTLIESLLDKAETYGKTSLKLATYKAVATSSDVVSSLAAKLAVAIIIAMFVLLASIGLALWLGKELGETFYGFFAVAIIYLFIGLLLYLLRDSLIKNPVSNFIISKLQK